MSNKMTPPVEKNEFIDVVFEDLTHDGAGVAKVKGYPIFVKNGLPGEEAQIKIIKVKKNFAFGRLMKLHQESPYRKDAECPVYNECGGCQPGERKRKRVVFRIAYASIIWVTI